MMPFTCNDPLAVALQLTINCKTYTSPESYNNHWLLCLRYGRCLGLGTGGSGFPETTARATYHHVTPLGCDHH